MNKEELKRQIKLNSHLEYDKVELRPAYVYVPVVIDLIDQLDEPEKVPQKWFDILERNKDLTLETILRIVNPRKEGEEERFVKAWLAYPNIEVEKEQKYEVKDKNDCFLLTKNSEGEVVNAYSKVVYKNKGQLTEKEIKDYDERFWIFAVPVEEEEKGTNQ